MGVRIVARKVDETDERVRYSFGLDERFDRTLVIDKAGWDVSLEAGEFDSNAGKIASKIRTQWQDTGEFPAGTVFAG